MDFSDNFFMADAVSRANDLTDIERDAILFSAETDAESSLAYNTHDDADYTSDENDPVVLMRKIALLKQSATFLNRDLRICKFTKLGRFNVFDSQKLKAYEKLNQEIDRMESRLNELLNQTTE